MLIYQYINFACFITSHALQAHRLCGTPSFVLYLILPDSHNSFSLLRPPTIEAASYFPKDLLFKTIFNTSSFIIMLFQTIDCCIPRIRLL